MLESCSELVARPEWWEESLCPGGGRKMYCCSSLAGLCSGPGGSRRPRRKGAQGGLDMLRILELMLNGAAVTAKLRTLPAVKDQLNPKIAAIYQTLS